MRRVRLHRSVWIDADCPDSESLSPKPHGFLSTHRHPELADEGLLQYHVTIDAPDEHNDCYLEVGGEFRQHTNGELWSSMVRSPISR